MNQLMVRTDPRVTEVFNRYPQGVREPILKLRQLILETANAINTIDTIEETLKWGEPSYLTSIGSTVRIDWKSKNPQHLAMYFKCTSKLVPTFKTVFKDTFKFESNRALLFELNKKIPEAELKQCIAMALTYHKVKHLPFLGYPEPSA